MQLGMIGLGRMGASLVRRLTQDGHKCVVYDLNPAAVKRLSGRGIRGCGSIDELLAKLARPRAVWLMVPAGAGHFVKMVHNGIEYGLMAAYAEGLNILKNADAGKRARAADAETAPLRDPEYYRYELDLPGIAELWRRGSVIGSWLLDLTAASLLDSPGLKNYAGRVSDSGAGRWTIAAAIDEGVPAPVLGAALYARFSSRDGADFANRVLSAMRKQFGGHEENKKRKHPR